MANKSIKVTDDILKVLCKSVTHILNQTTGSKVTYSPTIQKIDQTCLKPEISCFTVLDGAFTGIIIFNMSAEAAIELYHHYMKNMGIPEKELSKVHTSEDVANSLGELMNQIVGNFQGELRHQASIKLNQSQPKMIVLNKELMLSINANIDRPQSRRVFFTTQNGQSFHMEMTMEKIEFIHLEVEGDDVEKVTGTKEENQDKIFKDLNI